MNLCSYKLYLNKNNYSYILYKSYYYFVSLKTKEQMY